MFWPRLKLTPDEMKFSIKYDDPNAKQKAVLRRFYAGEIDISPTIRQDTETLQISRRCRVFGFTASGDVNQIEIQMTDISGEQYFTDYIPITDLLCGSNWDPRSVGFYNPTVLVPPTVLGIATGYVLGTPGYYVPFIMDPSIILAPNQTLSISARPIDPEREGPLHVDFNLHVWEFPGMPGSPQ